MEVLKRNIILFFLCAICKGSDEANIIIENLDVPTQVVWPSCMITIATKHFATCSSVAIVSDDESNMGQEMDISGWLAQHLMWKSRWSVVLKTISGANLKQEDVRIALFDYLYKQTKLYAKFYFRESINTFCLLNQDRSV